MAVVDEADGNGGGGIVVDLLPKLDFRPLSVGRPNEMASFSTTGVDAG